ncbi:MAG TPA: DUF2007 domain-containing protein [Bryobacteraceae bacterium]|nr:DUF2007 domain-containing protein [Bryobacteraceae bacterium]
MTQDPEGDERDEEQPDESVRNPSHDLDLVSIYDSTLVDAEMEADVIRGILETNGIPSIVVRAAGIPVLGFDVQVPRDRVEEAQRLIAEAQAAGPEAAAEAEAAGEESQPG